MTTLNTSVSARAKQFEIAQVAVPRPVPGPLSYRVPEALAGKIKVGSFVRVPFRRSTSEGFVTGFVPASDPSLAGFELKEVSELPFESAVFSRKDLEFYSWVAGYYQLPLGEVFHCAFPKSVFRIPKKARASRAENKIEFTPSKDFDFTPDQSASFARIQAAMASGTPKSFLLFGVTGSGKTEIYIRAAREALARGKGALILVPEIALTPQLRRRFEERFGDEVAVLHSGLTEKARRDFWWSIRRGERRVVVGARSAVFAPLENPGLVVVDEEHEPSYKQEDRLRYNARDLALVRARLFGAVAVLGSATPALETFYAANSGKHELLTLGSRPNARPLPSIEVVDLADEPATARNTDNDAPASALIGAKMRQGLEETLARGEQAMVFVNRKGYSNFVLCADCGHVPECLNCSVSLTYYRSASKLRCHYCGFEIDAIQTCAGCASHSVRPMGIGTEQVERELARTFPKARIARLDAEAASTTQKLEAALARFQSGETQILAGTQMLAKGHDFPNVTFIGVVLADLNLHLPDFRAGERTYQLLAQVAGRAGRADKPGRVVLQTYMPMHYVIRSSTAQDFAAFYSEELEHRRAFGYPPFSRIAQVEFRALKESAARREAERAAALLAHLQGAHPGGVAPAFTFLGPAPAAVAKVANRFRWQILLKSEKSSSLNAVIKTLRREGARFIDVDPVSTL
ncbi:MAG: primosomal protein N' [Deltaproteobacteria bacterium]|nr:primosomal protein N' [Deltaproteobacteria bacterium]